MTRKRREPTIDVRRYRLGDGSMTETYSVRYYDASGVRRRRACESPQEADFERARLVLEQTRGRAAVVSDEPEGAELTLGEFWPTWFADARGRLARSTLKLVRTDLEGPGRACIR